jgi:hypothetical protein
MKTLRYAQATGLLWSEEGEVSSYPLFWVPGTEFPETGALGVLSLTLERNVMITYDAQFGEISNSELLSTEANGP